jgi:phosphatidylserine/phosphatidylglycerophosphate/cardiolipin synthase-like enzyme
MTLAKINMKKYALFLLLLFLPMLAVAQITTEESFSPHQGATALIVRTIGDAQKSIRVAAYTFTSQTIAQALADAHQRGVNVQVVLNKSQRTSRSSVAGWLADNGIPVRFNSRYAIMHDKFLIIDDITLETGSFNFTKAAETRNAENVLVIHDDPKAVADYTQQWEKLWGEAE